MIDKRRQHSWFRLITLATLALAQAGCADELGPEPMAVVRVTGMVSNGRSPVRNGWIEFIPLDGTVGNPYSARIREDGSFVADRVSVGLNLIRLAHVSLGSNDAERMLGAYHSPIRRVISARSTKPLNINVFDEILQSKTHPPGRPNSPPREAGDPQ
jgi:hypothetical protein